MADTTGTTSTDSSDPLRRVVRKHWGYGTFRPLQYEAMQAARQGRDALVVLPTGGGKSLCYQAPALLADGPTLVVSPLISLMKDQVDRLLAHDVPAAFFNSSLSVEDGRRVVDGVMNRTYKLLFVAPERFSSRHFWDLLESGGIRAFAIDEAHCISHWGHDFRGDYRKLDQLKDRFPDASVHAFTATATPRVRQDIVDQLKLADPEVLVGDFFRPNLVYLVERRSDTFSTVLRTINARSRQAGIVYCIRRRDVDALNEFLKSEGIRVARYHAGMSDDERTQAQDAFAAGEVDVVVATVAFGMGIDRADIRFVIHAAMPKSIEHYQQETGRAGRDGLEAECLLFYNGADYHTWKNIIDVSEPTHREVFLGMLSHMYRFCTGLTCRHKALVTYFGQGWERTTCDACDVCNQAIEPMPQSTVTAQKIMSAVVRTGQRYGASYVCDVLMGVETEAVVSRGHDGQSTFGLMASEDKRALMSWIDQLIDQQMLEREEQYRVLHVAPMGWQVLRSQAEARLLPYELPRKEKTRRRRKPRSDRVGRPDVGTAQEAANRDVEDRSTGDVDQQRALSSEDVSLPVEDTALFEKLRALRREIADEMSAPAFVVFSDKTLRGIARAKPTDEQSLLDVKGVGPAKIGSFGERFLAAVRQHLTLP